MTSLNPGRARSVSTSEGSDNRAGNPVHGQRIAPVVNGGVAMTVTDEALMELVKRGDENAFEALLSRYERRIYGYVHRILGDPDEARDAFQETFYRVHRKAHHFRPGSRFSTWIYTIARNISFDLLDKRRRRGPGVSLDALEEAGIDPTSEADTNVFTPPPDPFASAERNELEAAVRDAIEKLPEVQRDVMLLKEYEHLTYSEIAEVLQCSVGTVKSRFHYAFIALKSMLAPLAEGSSCRGGGHRELSG